MIRVRLPPWASHWLILIGRVAMHSKIRGGSWQIVLLVSVVFLLGCGGRSDEPESSSHDEITTFLEENPEFAGPGTSQSDRAPLGLER